MKFGCLCGAVIYDSADFLSYKAHFVADRDWEDFLEHCDSHRGIDRSLVQTCYQCLQCGRLYFEDAEHNWLSFIPEDGRANVLGSSRGAAWRSPLVAIWNDDSSDGHAIGKIWCLAENGINEPFDDWKKMEIAYYSIFKKLRELDLLRSAFLRKNGDVLHSWSL